MEGGQTEVLRARGKFNRPEEGFQGPEGVGGTRMQGVRGLMID